MTDQQTKNVIIVLSPGRSGTSLLMQALNALGMSLSEDLLPGSMGNPDGFFEDKKILELHKKIYDGLNNQVFLPLPDGWQSKEEVTSTIPQIKKYVQEKIDESETIWGFKDPRTSSSVPLWSRMLNTPGFVPVFILAVRSPDSVVASLRPQINYEEAATELAWLTRTADPLFHTAADCFIVHYEDWFTEGTEVAKGLLRYTGLNPYFEGNVQEALQDVIKPNLNRAVYEDYEIKNEYVLKLYDVLKDCRGDDFDRARLMGVIKECRKAMHGFKGWYLEAQKYLKQVNTLKGQIKELKEKNRLKIEQAQSDLQNQTYSEINASLEKLREQQKQLSDVLES